MTMLPADGACIVRPQRSPPASVLEKVLRGLSVFTMLMTVPQVLTIWVGRDAGGISLVSWVSYLVAACLWFVYGIQKRDKTIYPACVGWVALAVEDTAQRLPTDVAQGLSGAEAARRYAQDGPNALPAVKARSGLSILLHQFRSLIVLLLLAAGGVTLALGENVEAAAILVVIVLNAVIGFLTEWKAEAALDALRKQTVASAHVLREGAEHQIPRRSWWRGMSRS